MRVGLRVCSTWARKDLRMTRRFGLVLIAFALGLVARPASAETIGIVLDTFPLGLKGAGGNCNATNPCNDGGTIDADQAGKLVTSVAGVANTNLNLALA